MVTNTKSIKYAALMGSSSSKSSGGRLGRALKKEKMTYREAKDVMPVNQKKSTLKESNERDKTESMKEKDGSNGITIITPENALVKSKDASVAIRPTDSVTPFPNIDQVQSESTNLIDGTTKQLYEFMTSLGKQAKVEENIFSTAKMIGTAANCAKQIQTLLRLKLDIYKAYKK